MVKLILNFNLGKNEKSKKKKFLFNLYFVLPNFKLGKKVKKGEAQGWDKEQWQAKLGEIRKCGARLEAWEGQAGRYAWLKQSE